MMKLQAQPLDLNTLPLAGRILIEASAGTGKTYSLAIIYLRLLLGIGQNNSHRALLVEEILVVTFTNAATEELRHRIRQNTTSVRLALQGDCKAVNEFGELLTLIDNKEVAIKRLKVAEQNIDNAAIFTINGFCQRILTTYAFEAGILFNQQLDQNSDQNFLQAVFDFWRENLTPLSQLEASTVKSFWNSPLVLKSKVQKFIGKTLPKNAKVSHKPINKTISDFVNDKNAIFSKIKNEWLNAVNDITQIISQSDVSKLSYSKKNLPNWTQKVTDWAYSDSLEYDRVPLEKFSQNELNKKTKDGGTSPKHPIFEKIEALIESNLNVKNELENLILFDAVIDIKKRFDEFKLAKSAMNFDDQLMYLYDAIKRDNTHQLTKKIAEKYPVALVDEFQDTDEIQYYIFDSIYSDREKNGLILIGDPKQAIYRFRGADIFTYIKAKKASDYLYSMDVNWRSTSQMINVVNQFFTRQKSPFLFDEIPFYSMNFAPKNTNKTFLVDNQILPACSVDMLALPDQIYKQDYDLFSANNCAKTIANLLSKQAIFCENDNKKPLKSNDIAVLVRTAEQANMIKRALLKQNIKSVFLSNNQMSVYDSDEASELLIILEAILDFESESKIKNAMATSLMGLSLLEINQLQQDSIMMENAIKQFKDYHQTWQDFGIFVMLKQLNTHQNIIRHLLSQPNGERAVTNLMHLAEILQKQASKSESAAALVHWFAQNIFDSEASSDAALIRLESDEELIQIITIHKSKGLEYPVVFLPFIGTNRKSDHVTYHDENTNELNYAYSPNEKINALIEKEQLAEDLRLLYVAMTRSIYHCHIGLALTKSFFDSAIAYLLTDAEAKDKQKSVIDSLEKMNDLKLTIFNEIDDKHDVFITQKIKNHKLETNIFTKKIDKQFQITSYSALTSAHAKSESIIESYNKLDEELANTANKQAPEMNTNEIIYDIHHFPKGAQIGVLLHECFEKLFLKNDHQMLKSLVDRLNIEEHWIAPLNHWFEYVINTPLLPDFSLNELQKNKQLVELEFYLPIKQSFDASKFDLLTKKYDPLSQKRASLDFKHIKGMLKGFIDLIFMWQGKYYIVDYKSNWLGDDYDAYQRSRLCDEMISHRYDVQYQLYTLALHRYLSSRIENYHYETHFGGVFYLFVRGMKPELNDNGIFYVKPPYELTKALDQLFCK